MSKLTIAVTEEQKKLGLSDRKLAQRLGIDNSHWSRIKRGHLPPGHKFLSAVAHEFPELQPLVFQVITGGE